jgi:predicted nucleotidyltransferase
MVGEGELASLVKEIRAHYKPQRMILFGSYARDQAHAGSDLNLCLVVPEAGDWLERQAEFLGRFDLPGVALRPVIYTDQELERLRAEGHPFVREILEEGRVLHERRRS